MQNPIVVFLDRATFPRTIKIPKLNFKHTWKDYSYTQAKDLINRAKNAKIIITNKVNIHHQELEQLPKLKMISLTATGMNNIDLEACKEKNILVTNVRDYGTESVAEHAFMLLLNLFHQAVPYLDSLRKGDWSNSKSFTYFLNPVRELASTRLAIIGPGVLGQRVGKFATAFDMEVVYVGNTKNTVSTNQKKYPHLKLIGFKEALKTADAISIHCPLTDTTRDLFTKTEFSQMKKSAILINTARGGIVNEPDLVTAIKNNKIAGAGFDVLTTEPPPKNHPLLKLMHHPRFILTPHMAWLGERSLNNLLRMAFQNVEKFYLSLQPLNTKTKTKRIKHG